MYKILTIKYLAYYKGSTAVVYLLIWHIYMYDKNITYRKHTKANYVATYTYKKSTYQMTIKLQIRLNIVCILS